MFICEVVEVESSVTLIVSTLDAPTIFFYFTNELAHLSFFHSFSCFAKGQGPQKGTLVPPPVSYDDPVQVQ